MSTIVSDRYIDYQRRITKALIKFCDDHMYPPLGLTDVQHCLKALEQADVAAAYDCYRKVPLGGRMGYFDDWIPSAKYENETSDYVQVVFNALLNEWDRVMKLSIAGVDENS